MRTNTLIAAIICSGVVSLCFLPVAQAQSGHDNVKVQDIKNETKELIDALQQYTAVQRDQAVKEAGQALKKLDQRIDELETSVDNNWDNLTQAARQKASANLKTLRQQRNELAEWYGRFKNSSVDAWEQMKTGFAESYQSLSESWEKAKSEYDRGNK